MLSSRCWLGSSREREREDFVAFAVRWVRFWSLGD